MSIQGQYESSYRLTEQEQQDQLTQLAMQHEQDELEAEQNWEPKARTLGDFRVAFWRAARNYLRQKKNMAYWAQDGYAGMNRMEQARKLDFLQMCLDKARCEYRNAWDVVSQQRLVKGGG